MLRDGDEVWKGKIASLKRFKDDVSEVRQGVECGIDLAGFKDIRVGDIIEAFTTEKLAAELGQNSAEAESREGREGTRSSSSGCRNSQRRKPSERVVQLILQSEGPGAIPALLLFAATGKMGLCVGIFSVVVNRRFIRGFRRIRSAERGVSMV